VRLARGRARRPEEGGRVEETRQGARPEALAALYHGAEDVLPAQHPVGQEVEPGLLLNRDELGEVTLDLLVDRLRRRAPTVEVARRLDERLRARVNPGYECFHLASCLECLGIRRRSRGYQPKRRLSVRGR